MSQSDDTIALILGAGKGKRMKSGSSGRSDLPKILQKLNGRYVVDYVIDSARKADIERQILVIGHQAEKARTALQDRGVEFVEQTPQLGTGHAVMMAEPALAGFEGDLVVLCGDMPLVRPETIRRLIDERLRLDAAAVVLTAVLDDPAQYGRVVRDDEGLLKAIVEYRDADDKVRKIDEVNTATYCFRWPELRPILGRLKDDNDQKEFYLTDSIAILVGEGRKVGAVVADDPREGLGVNSPEELGRVEKLIKNGTRRAE
jgi:bifunctional UDP-N-acetylglucosamine pyrophosphorylase/glucosamine-1-phosphate N-acetyltransferase